MANDLDKYLAVLKAAYDYSPQSEDEIEIKEDQILFLKERVDDESVSRSFACIPCLLVSRQLVEGQGQRLIPGRR